jgi:hypothetical protein
MKRAELDARKAPPAYSEGANPVSHLAEVFNDYEGFTPQNLMVEYLSPGINLPPVKKNPYQSSAPKWSYLATLHMTWSLQIWPEENYKRRGLDQDHLD